MPPEQIPMSGTIPYAVGAGMASKIRIPVSGTNGLAIEFTPRNFKGKSTSSLFLQDITGRRHLRLDYGPNVKLPNNGIDYHWNQKGTHGNFGINNHQSTGTLGKFGYKAAKYFRYLGRAFMVAGAALDAYSIVVADKPLRRASEVVSAWALAFCGCKVVGAGGAMGGGALGTAVPVVGNAVGATVGGLGGCIVGGIGGYMAGEKLGGMVYDWAENTIFTPVPTTNEPPVELLQSFEILQCVPTNEITPRPQMCIE